MYGDVWHAHIAHIYIYMYVYNHYVVHLNLIQCYMPIITQFEKKKLKWGGRRGIIIYIGNKAGE